MRMRNLQEPSARDLGTGAAGTLRSLAEGLLAAHGSGHEQDASSLLSLVRRLERLVEDLEACAGRQTLLAETLRPAELLKAFASAVQPLLDRRLELRLLVDDDCPPCRADAGALQDGLLHLVADARDRMPGGGTVTLTARRGRLDDGTDATEFGVLDGGRALPPALAAAAAIPSPTGEAALPDGLAAVDGFARQSGGCLRRHSGPEGASALLLLPCGGIANDGRRSS
jgi:signal transduction histidine kinase